MYIYVYMYVLYVQRAAFDSAVPLLAVVAIRSWRWTPSVSVMLLSARPTPSSVNVAQDQ